MELSIRLESRNAREGHPCIWMQAGVIRRKFCKIDYHCETCRYDRIMSRVAEDNRRLRSLGKVPQGKRGRIVSWKDRLRALPPWKRPCIHQMKGHINFKACTNEYRCGECEFDQYFYDQCTVHAEVTPVDVFDIKGFRIPQGYYLHEGHAWARLEESPLVRVGMDDFALRLLGPPDRIEAPLMGKEVRQGRADITVCRGSCRAKVVSPVSGVVTSVNPSLREQGSLANKDPFSGGWIMRVFARDLRQDLRNLMINNETRKFMGDEVGRLYDVIEEVGGPLATDGGYLGPDIYGSMPQLGWERLAGLFLRT